jgi:hypothetical protein
VCFEVSVIQYSKQNKHSNIQSEQCNSNDNSLPVKNVVDDVRAFDFFVTVLPRCSSSTSDGFLWLQKAQRVIEAAKADRQTDRQTDSDESGAHW